MIVFSLILFTKGALYLILGTTRAFSSEAAALRGDFCASKMRMGRAYLAILWSAAILRMATLLVFPPLWKQMGGPQE